MDQKPDVIEGFRTTSFRTNDTQHALLALALSTTNFHGIGPEGFYLFDLQGDATIVSKLSDSSMSVLDLQGGGDLEVTTHKMPTYPILRACLHWKRKDGRFLTQENILDVRWVDVQRFFDSMLRTSTVVIHAVESEAPIPRFSARLSIDRERSSAYKAAAVKATKWYRNIPEHTRDFRAATQRFWEEHPM